MFKELNHQQKGSLLAFVGVMFLTPDSLFIRLASIDTWPLLFYRGAIPFTAVFLGLLVIYRLKILKIFISTGYPGIAYALTFAITNITFIVSIQNTNVANTLVMVALAPMLSAILGLIFGESKTDSDITLSSSANSIPLIPFEDLPLNILNFLDINLIHLPRRVLNMIS